MKTIPPFDLKRGVDIKFPSWLVFVFLGLLTGCGFPHRATGTVSDSQPAPTCSLTEPQWEKPPEDSAVSGSPDYGHYFINENRSIWASAWWHGQEAEYLRAGEEGIKVGWFRPAGATLVISGHRLDGDGPPLHAEVPCCYPTRFQASGLYFPTEGCWEVSAEAADETLTFIVWVEP